MWQDSNLTHVKVMEWTSGAGRVLWARPDRGALLIQAAAPVSPGAVPAGCAKAITSRPVRLHWPAGTQVRFALVGNPTKAVPQRDGPDGRCTRRSPRRPLPLAERDAWLRRKLDGALDVTEAEGQPLGARTGRRGDGRVTHVLHCWTGCGTVTGPTRLAELIIGGVGPGKAFGAGLLIVRDAA